MKYSTYPFPSTRKEEEFQSIFSTEIDHLLSEEVTEFPSTENLPPVISVDNNTTILQTLDLHKPGDAAVLLEVDNPDPNKTGKPTAADAVAGTATAGISTEAVQESDSSSWK